MTTTKENGKKVRKARAVIQLSAEEHDNLTRRAKYDGLSVSSYVRRLIFKEAAEKEKQAVES